ncbi:hypothetical protein [Nitratifractor sp.]
MQFYLREFKSRLEEELSSGRAAEYPCFNTLRALDETLEEKGHSFMERAALLNGAAEEMAEYVETHITAAARRLYRYWKESSQFEKNEFREVKERLDFLKYCFHETCDELEHFRHARAESLLNEETMARAKERLVRFEQLIETYLRLLELELQFPQRKEE